MAYHKLLQEDDRMVAGGEVKAKDLTMAHHAWQLPTLIGHAASADGRCSPPNSRGGASAFLAGTFTTHCLMG